MFWGNVFFSVVIMSVATGIVGAYLAGGAPETTSPALKQAGAVAARVSFILCVLAIAAVVVCRVWDV
jgi:hypothetical protein